MAKQVKDKEEEVKNEVVQATPMEVSTDVDTGFSVSAADCALGRVGIMDSQHPFVKKGQALVGDIIEMNAMSKLGDKNAPLEIILIGVMKYQEDKCGEEFVGKSSLPSNFRITEWEKTFTLGGRQITRTYIVCLIFLLAEELKVGLAFPYSLNLKNTALRNYEQRIAPALLRIQVKNQSHAASLSGAGVQEKFLSLPKSKYPNLTHPFLLKAALLEDRKGHSWWGPEITPVNRETTDQELKLSLDCAQNFSKLQSEVLSKSESAEENNTPIEY